MAVCVASVTFTPNLRSALSISLMVALLNMCASSTYTKNGLLRAFSMSSACTSMRFFASTYKVLRNMDPRNCAMSSDAPTDRSMTSILPSSITSRMSIDDFCASNIAATVGVESILSILL